MRSMAGDTYTDDVCDWIEGIVNNITPDVMKACVEKTLRSIGEALVESGIRLPPTYVECDGDVYLELLFDSCRLGLYLFHNMSPASWGLTCIDVEGNIRESGGDFDHDLSVTARTISDLIRRTESPDADGM